MNKKVYIFKHKNKKMVLDITSANTFFINELEEKLLNDISHFSNKELIKKN